MSPRTAGARRILPGSPFKDLHDAGTVPLDLAVDDRVTHQRHGMGRVVALEGEESVVVDFRSEVRRISRTSTKLHKL